MNNKLPVQMVLGDFVPEKKQETVTAPVSLQNTPPYVPQTGRKPTNDGKRLAANDKD